MSRPSPIGFEYIADNHPEKPITAADAMQTILAEDVNTRIQGIHDRETLIAIFKAQARLMIINYAIHTELEEPNRDQLEDSLERLELLPSREKELLDRLAYTPEGLGARVMIPYSPINNLKMHEEEETFGIPLSTTLGLWLPQPQGALVTRVNIGVSRLSRNPLQNPADLYGFKEYLKKPEMVSREDFEPYFDTHKRSAHVAHAISAIRRGHDPIPAA